jgi:dimethylaniline monooxygenase (N-oxide forming)
MVHSERHLTGIIRYLPYCDDLLSELHASPSLRVLLRQVFTHSPLTWLRIMQAVYFGISSPAQYRLFGDGAKTELAKATLLRLASCGTALSAEEKAALESQE